MWLTSKRSSWREKALRARGSLRTSDGFKPQRSHAHLAKGIWWNDEVTWGARAVIGKRLGVTPNQRGAKAVGIGIGTLAGIDALWRRRTSRSANKVRAGAAR